MSKTYRDNTKRIYGKNAPTADGNEDLLRQADGLSALSGTIVGRDEVAVVGLSNSNLQVNLNLQSVASGGTPTTIGRIPAAITSGQSIEWISFTVNGALAYIPIWR